MKDVNIVLDINGIEIIPGMRVVRLIKGRNNAKGIEGIVVNNKYKEHGLAIQVEFGRYFDESIMPNSGGYFHGIKKNNNYLVLGVN